MRGIVRPFDDFFVSIAIQPKRPHVSTFGAKATAATATTDSQGARVGRRSCVGYVDTQLLGKRWSKSLFAIDARGRCYQDFYKVISDYDTRTDLPSLMTLLKEECLAYQQHLFDQSWVSGPDGTAVQALENSSAGDGNFLEATNLALNLFERVYINRDLSRTGLSVLVVTPGTGLFEVNHDLLKLTKHRMIDLGIGCDVLCLSRPPLHTVPLFRSILSSGQVVIVFRCEYLFQCFSLFQGPLLVATLDRHFILQPQPVRPRATLPALKVCSVVQNVLSTDGHCRGILIIGKKK